MNDTLNIGCINNDNFEDNYNHIFAESMFMLNQAQNEVRLYRAYQEACCLENSNIEGLIQINEGVWQSIKNFVTKVWNAIVKMINKFFSRLDQLLSGTEEWLKQHEEVILRKNPIKDVEITIYEYDIQKYFNVQVYALPGGMINWYESEEKAQVAASKNLIDKGILKTSEFSEENNDFDLKSVVEFNVRGSEEKKKRSQDLKLADMYNFCLNFKDIKSSIKNDMSALDNLSEKIEAQLNEIYDDIEKVKKEKQNGIGGPTNQETDKNAEVLGKDGKPIGNTKVEINNNSSVIYSDIGNAYYIHEMKIGSKPSNTKSNTSSSSNYANKYNSNINSTILGTKKDEEWQKKNITTMTTNATQGISLEDAQNSVKWYYNACGEILGAKCTLGTAMFKDFMEILRWHVDQFTPSQAKDFDKSSDKGTKFNKQSKQNKENEERLKVYD